MKSSNLQLCFQGKTRDNINNTKQTREAFEQALVIQPIEGSLRVHIELPRAAKGASTTRVEGNDVLAFITCDNLDEFFWENSSNDTWNQSMKALKNIIRLGMHQLPVNQLIFC